MADNDNTSHESSASKPGAPFLTGVSALPGMRSSRGTGSYYGKMKAQQISLGLPSHPPEKPSNSNVSDPSASHVGPDLSAVTVSRVQTFYPVEKIAQRSPWTPVSIEGNATARPVIVRISDASAIKTPLTLASVTPSNSGHVTTKGPAKDPSPFGSPSA